MSITGVSYARTVFLLAVAALCTGGRALSAQQSARSWKFDPQLSVVEEYDDNVFLLSPSAQSKLSASAGSSRYANMLAAGDAITTVRAELGMRGDGLGGRTLTITPELKYDYYARNTERGAAQLSITMAQDLARGSRVRLMADMTPSSFYKTYLSNAIDADASGSISASERVYEPASYAEREVGADYRTRIRKGHKASPTDVFLQLGAGYYARNYDAPFSVRDYSGPLASLTTTLERRRFEIAAKYELARLSATPGRAVRLLDEPAFGVDFNGNGNATDLNARAFQMVDYSRNEQELALESSIAATKRLNLKLSVARRWRSFTSDQPYDTGNNGREDSRDTFGAAASMRMAPAVRLIAGVEMQKQGVNKPLDQIGEVTDYTRLRTSLGLRYTP